MINDYSEKIKDEKKGSMITAFYSAYFQRVEKLTSDELNNILEKIDHSEEEMTDNDMFSMVKKISASMGGD